jgi:flagellar hook-associated protein 2
MPISATSGVVSSIDYESLITQLVNVRRQSITSLEQDRKDAEKAKSAYSTLSSKITDLNSAANDLKSLTAFDIFSTSTTDSTIFEATATSSASKGTYDVRVDAIAKAHKVAADGVTAESSIIASASGSFSFQVGSGTVQTVAIDATTTLTGLRDAINALDAGATATIVNDGSGATPYRLILSSDTTGTANAVTITQNDTDLVFSTTLQAAQDASFNVDGLTITRSTNTITDVITGVTLDLKSADAAKTVTLSVNRDTDKITEKVQAFVDKYNAVVSFIKSKNRYDNENKVAGEFFGDSVARSVWEDLRRSMTSAISGLPSSMNRLIHAGITSDSEGLMKLDTSDFKDALSSSFDDVVALFKDDPAGTKGFGGLLYDITYNINDVVDGRLKGRQDGLSSQITRIDRDVLSKEADLVRYEEGLRAQLMGLETMLASLKSQSSFLMNLG